MSKITLQQAQDRQAAALLSLAIKVKAIKSVDDLKNFASKNEFEAQAQDGQLGTYEYGGHPMILLKYAGVVHEFPDHELITGWLDKKVQITAGDGPTGTEQLNRVLIKIGEHTYATSLDQLQDWIDLTNKVVDNSMTSSGNKTQINENKAQIATLKAFARYLGTINGTAANDLANAPATRPDNSAIQNGDYIILKYGLPLADPTATKEYAYQEFVWESGAWTPLGNAHDAHPHSTIDTLTSTQINNLLNGKADKAALDLKADKTELQKANLLSILGLQEKIVPIGKRVMWVAREDIGSVDTNVWEIDTRFKNGQTQGKADAVGDSPGKVIAHSHELWLSTAVKGYFGDANNGGVENSPFSSGTTKTFGGANNEAYIRNGEYYKNKVAIVEFIKAPITNGGFPR